MIVTIRAIKYDRYMNFTLAQGTMSRISVSIQTIIKRFQYLCSVARNNIPDEGKHLAHYCINSGGVNRSGGFTVLKESTPRAQILHYYFFKQTLYHKV